MIFISLWDSKKSKADDHRRCPSLIPGNQLQKLLILNLNGWCYQLPYAEVQKSKLFTYSVSLFYSVH
jgi:hypothetical protein